MFVSIPDLCLLTYFVLFCCDRDFILCLSDNNQANVIEAFNPTSRYLDDLLNIDYPFWRVRPRLKDDLGINSSAGQYLLDKRGSTGIFFSSDDIL